MKKFKTEKIIYFNTKNSSETESDAILSQQKEKSKNKFICYKADLISKKFLNKKRYYLDTDKYDTFYNIQQKKPKEGKWTLKEHIQFLQGLDKFGMKWSQISNLIPTRTIVQVMSHSQKFFKKLKECRDNEIGIDFTKRNIRNINDMIKLIKSVNKNYNIVTVFLYLSEKCSSNQNLTKCNKENFNINDILCEDISKNIINDNDTNYNSNIKENIIINNYNIVYNINNNTQIGNILINNNNNYLHNIKGFDMFMPSYLYNSIYPNFINNNISNQYIPYNSMNILDHYYINNDSTNLSGKNYINDYRLNNLVFNRVNHINDTY